MNARTLPQFLAAAKGDVVDRDRALPVAEVERMSRRVAGALSRRGVQPGDRIAVWLPNVAAWLVMLAACARLGAIVVAMNTRFKSAELADIVARTRSRFLMYWPGFRGIDFDQILRSVDKRVLQNLEGVILYEEGGERASQGADWAVHRYGDLLTDEPWAGDYSAPGAPCIIFTTSGTTKLPKFVVHDQQTLVRHARSAAEAFGYDAPGAKILVSAPFCGAYGFCTLMAGIAGQGPVFFYPGTDPAEAAQAVRRHGITHTNATDDFIARMLAVVPEDPPFPSARFFGYAAFTPALSELAVAAGTRGLKLVGLYGSSELQALLARQSVEAPVEQRTNAGGTLVAPGGRVRARDPESAKVLADGAAGELEFDVPSRLVRYFKDDAATRNAFTPDGWFKSGDLGYTTGQSSFVFIARLGDALRLSGFLVSPAEIEGVLQEHPHVQAAQVVGVDTPGGVRPFAFVIPRPDAQFDERAVHAHCAARLAKLKLPLRIHALSAFPVAASANATKIQKSQLREMAQEMVSSQRV